MLKVMTIVGTRPELIKMFRVIAEFDHHTNHILVHTGQIFDYELNQIFSMILIYVNQIIF
jgi:UDP-N-acetylglucosamine 2-epimerase